MAKMEMEFMVYSTFLVMAVLQPASLRKAQTRVARLASQAGRVMTWQQQTHVDAFWADFVAVHRFFFPRGETETRESPPVSSLSSN
jgi:hypothetical protein